MDVRPLLRLVAIAVLVLATALSLRASRRWPARRTSGLVAGALAVLALAGFALSTLDLLAPHAPDRHGPLALHADARPHPAAPPRPRRVLPAHGRRPACTARS